MIFHLTLLATLALAQIPPTHPNGFLPSDEIPCELSGNSANGLNYYGCNDAGRCEKHGDPTASGIQLTRCNCCDIYSEDSWCYNPGNELVGQLDDGSAYQRSYMMTGTYCSKLTQKQYKIYGFRMVADPGETLPFQCVPIDPSTTNVNDCKGTPRLCTTVRNGQPFNLHAGATMALREPCTDQSCTDTISSTKYNGYSVDAGCYNCSPDTPCDANADQPPGLDGITVTFITQLDLHYDQTCPVEYPAYSVCHANTDHGHQAEYAFEVSMGHPEYLTAMSNFAAVLSGAHPKCGQAPYLGLCEGYVAAGFKTSPKVGYPSVFSVQSTEVSLSNFFIYTNPPTATPTLAPTDPTAQPTPMPTSGNPCFKYINEVKDLKLKGSGDNCRGGISEEWPGGRTCDSPYVVCLPDEHTPANPDPSNEPNVGKNPDAALYTTSECYEECAFDQRCMGFEFILQAGSNLGQCVLIDDLDIVIVNAGAWPAVGDTIGSATVESQAQVAQGIPELKTTVGECCTMGNNLLDTFFVAYDECRDRALALPNANFYSTIGSVGICRVCEACDPTAQSSNILFETKEIVNRFKLGSPANFDSVGAAALCFAKEDYCNPYFEANDLNEEMLKCYCPNNRKGTYTKKVKRTVANTRYCEDVPEISERIKKAQANRMFHLCENWCLFETNNPKTESWYWDPWQKCWREQYAGTGTHRSYCNRVIRNPDTIEQKFIEYRSDNFCKKDPITNEVLKEITEEPTQQPSTFDVTWYLADQEESCDDVCTANGAMCDELTTNSLVWSDGFDPALMTNALTEAAPDLAGRCATQVQGQEGWALPAVSSDKCYLRHPDTEYTGCNWPTGKGFRRLCACYTA